MMVLGGGQSHLAGHSIEEWRLAALFSGYTTRTAAQMFAYLASQLTINPPHEASVLASTMGTYIACWSQLWRTKIAYIRIT